MRLRFRRLAELKVVVMAPGEEERQALHYLEAHSEAAAVYSQPYNVLEDRNVEVHVVEGWPSPLELRRQVPASPEDWPLRQLWSPGRWKRSRYLR